MNFTCAFHTDSEKKAKEKCYAFKLMPSKLTECHFKFITFIEWCSQLSLHSPVQCVCLVHAMLVLCSQCCVSRGRERKKRVRNECSVINAS